MSQDRVQAEEYKRQGNAYYTSQDYERAKEFYSKAIGNFFI